MTKERRKLPVTAAAITPEVSQADRQAFMGKAQVFTQPVIIHEVKKGPMKPRMFRFAQEDDERLASLVTRLDVAQVRPIPSGADLVRAALRVMEGMDDQKLAALFR
jgi:hypothetical protein